jgi:hypothetical protein
MRDTTRKSDPAFRLVGRFMFLWGALEHRIVGTLKEILSIPEPQASIIFANVTFRDKTSKE